MAAKKLLYYLLVRLTIAFLYLCFQGSVNFGGFFWFFFLMFIWLISSGWILIFASIEIEKRFHLGVFLAFIACVVEFFTSKFLFAVDDIFVHLMYAATCGVAFFVVHYETVFWKIMND